MLRLGHIEYSNCFPVHALLLDRRLPAGIELVRGTPAELNAELAAGRVDVAPCSSIEYARHAARYRLLPGLVIGSSGPVGSILLESDGELDALDVGEVAVPTASASSVVLLRLLLELRIGLRPRYRWFDQAAGRDPIEDGARAALWIGDDALHRPRLPGRRWLDLGEAWTAWTGLPFVYALWQTGAGSEKDAELGALHDLLLDSLAFFEAECDALAARHAARFGYDAPRLARYWRSLRYALDEPMREGLLHFFRLAAQLGEAPAVPELRWLTRAAA